MTFAERLFVGALSLLLTGVALAGPKVESWTTARGAKVMYVHAPDLPMLDVRVVFDAGSARDGEKPGLATLTNALLTEGAGPWDADQLAARVEDAGVELSNDSLRDMAYVSIRSLTDADVMEVALETLAKVLAEPRFEEGDFERQRQLMLIALSKQQEKPGDVAARAFWEMVYGEHPYAHDPMGDEASVSALTRDDVKAFHLRYYVARNAVIAIVGAVDRSAAEDLAEQVSEGLPEGRHAARLPPVPAAEGRERRIVFDAKQTHIRLGGPGMSRHDPEYFSLYVGNHILGGNGLVSMLSEEVREQRGLAYSVYSYFSPMSVPGPFLMAAQTRNERAEETLHVLGETLRRFMAQGPSEERLTAAKRNLTGGFPLRVASNGKIVQYLAMIGFYDYPLDYLDTFVERVNAVTVTDIRRAFRRHLDPDRLVTVMVGGADSVSE